MFNYLYPILQFPICQSNWEGSWQLLKQTFPNSQISPLTYFEFSLQIPDFKVPFKISHHPVCSYGGQEMRLVQLRGCDPRIPNTEVKVFDATHCSCKPCSPKDTSCQNWNG